MLSLHSATALQRQYAKFLSLAVRLLRNNLIRVLRHFWHKNRNQPAEKVENQTRPDPMQATGTNLTHVRLSSPLICSPSGHTLR